MGATATQSDPFLGYLMPKLKRAHRDRGAAEVLKALEAGRSLDNAILDTIEALPKSDTRKLRLWVEEARGLSRQRRDDVVDEVAADELLIYLDNERDIFEFKKVIAANLLKKIASGAYDERRAQAAWMPVVERAAKKYAREFSSSEREWSTIFSPATRDSVAKEIADRWYAAAKRGDPDDGLL